MTRMRKVVFAVAAILVVTCAFHAQDIVKTLTVDVNMPMIGMFKRKAEKTIIDGALKGLKKRVEG